MNKKKIIVLGGGYGGILTAKNLAKKIGKYATITLIDKKPYHTLLTEIHEVACERVENENVKVYFDKIFAESNIEIVMDEVTKIDFPNKKLIGVGYNAHIDDSIDNIQVSSKTPVIYEYDYLVVGTGSKPQYFGIEGARENTLTLWSYENAITIKNRILDSMEKASQETDPKIRKELLTFVICGAGFSGVEMSTEIAESMKYTYCRKYNIDYSEINISVINAGPRILAPFTDKAAAKTHKYMEKIGINIIGDAMVSKVEPNKIFWNKNKESLRANTIIWTTGIEGSDVLCNNDGCIVSPARGRIQTNEFLEAVEVENAYVVGDNTFFIPKGEQRPLPQMVENCEAAAPVIAHNIKCDVLGIPEKKKSYNPTFHGAIVSCGSRYGVAELKFAGKTIIFSGFLAMLGKNAINLLYIFMIAGYSQAWSAIKQEFFYTKDRKNSLHGLLSSQSPSIYLVPLRITLGILMFYSALSFQMNFLETYAEGARFFFLPVALTFTVLALGFALIIGLFITPVVFVSILVALTLSLLAIPIDYINSMKMILFIPALLSLVGIGSYGTQPLSVDYFLYPALKKWAKSVPLLRKFYLYND